MSIDDLMERVAAFREWLGAVDNPADFNGLEYFKIQKWHEDICERFDKTFPEVG